MVCVLIHIHSSTIIYFISAHLYKQTNIRTDYCTGNVSWPPLILGTIVRQPIIHLPTIEIFLRYQVHTIGLHQNNAAYFIKISSRVPNSRPLTLITLYLNIHIVYSLSYSLAREYYQYLYLKFCSCCVTRIFRHFGKLVGTHQVLPPWS